MKRYLCALCFAVFLLANNAVSQDVKALNAVANDIEDFGKRAKELASHIRVESFGERMFSDAIMSFDRIVDLLTLYIDEARAMVHREFMENDGWIEELKKDGFIDAALIEAGSTRYSVGETTSMGSAAEDISFYIDESGGVHYIYDKDDDPLSLDLSLTFPGFERHVSSLDRPPESLFLYDHITNRYSALHGSVEDIPEGVMRKGEDPSRRRITLTVKSLMVAQRVDIENSELALIAVYQYKAGRAAVQLFGLIGVVILTILLLSFAIYFAFQSVKKKGAQTMGEEEKGDIITEIDKELSGFGKEEEKPAPEAPSEKKEKDVASKRLEDDGIFIHE